MVNANGNENGSGGGKKRNRNKNKNKKKQQQSGNDSEVKPVQTPEEFQPPPTTSVAQVTPIPSTKNVPTKKVDSSLTNGHTKKSPAEALVENLALDYSLTSKMYDMAAIQQAELAYYQHLAKKVSTSAAASSSAKNADSSSDVDLFASDDEPVAEKPKMVKPSVPKPPPAANKKTSKKSAPVDKPKNKESKKAEVENSTLDSTTRSNPANYERSFIMLKPDAVHRGLIGVIIKRFESKGFKLVAMKFMKASRNLLELHYADLSKKPFFPDLISYMASGPVVPMVFEGLNVVKTGRLMLGATNPKDSAPGTIRGDFCIDVGRNIIHGSDSVEAAQKEIQLWFGHDETTAWKSCQIEWIYEDEVVDGIAAMAGRTNPDLVNKINALELENKNLKKVTDDLKNLVLKLENRVASLENGGKAVSSAPAAKEEDDDDVDLFGSGSDDEEEDAEKARIREERLKAYHEKKSKKPALIAKTSVLLDVKPWDDETDMDAMLKACKTIQKEGLVWGASKLVPVGYGIQKLQVMCVVEDEKVSIDELCEQITEFEDYVQSVDVASMSKI